MDDNRTVKQKIKDSVFTTLFRDANNVLELYKKLHPEDIGVTVDDIQIETLETVLVNEIYNDLGFIVNHGDRARYVILVEAQSKWTENMTLRMLFYISETYRRYLNETNQSEHLEKRVYLPKPEMYVVYHGAKDVTDEISFSQNYFDGNSPLELRVSVLRQIGTDTIYGQFIGFSRVYDEQRKRFGNKLECLKETIRICLEEGYLTAFLLQHKQEVNTMMSELFDEQAMREQYNKALAKQYKEEFEAKGRIETLIELVRSGDLTIERAAERYGVSVESFKELMT